MSSAGLEDEFGDIIQKARRGLGLELAELAARTGIPARRLQQFENYEAEPSEREVSLLAAALELKADALFEIARGWIPAPVNLGALRRAVVRQIAVPFGGYSSNCYIIGCKKTGLAAVVDPGGSSCDIAALLDAHKLRLAAVLLTHGDADHTAGIGELLGRTEVVKVICHASERVAVQHEANEDGDELAIGHLVVKLIYTPGHTPGSACYLADAVCFTGDTLFAGSLGGATRYPGGYRDILRSAARLMALPDDTILLPGHGPATTVAEEKEHNPFLRPL